MTDQQERSRQRGSVYVLARFAGALLVITGIRCGPAPPTNLSAGESVLRVGFGQTASASSKAGLRPVVQKLSIEGLVALGQDGRPQPSIATSWEFSSDRLQLTVQLRKNVRFQDGTPLTSQTIVDVLGGSLPASMGPAYDDIASIQAISDEQIQFKLRRPSAFLLDALETDISKPGAAEIGTGPFMVALGNPMELRANRNYYLGPPAIERVVLNTYPSERAAWAELLRRNIDVVYELGGDALDSLETATTIDVLTFVRPYQYLVLFNSKRPVFRSTEVRRALNAGIDRAALVRDALYAHGTTSAGPIWSKHWAAQGKLPAFNYDPEFASKVLWGRGQTNNRRSGFQFTCLVAPENERLALVVKRQLEAVGAEMLIQEASVEQISRAYVTNTFDTILADAVSGPSLFRAYWWWRSHGTLNSGFYSSSTVDAALDAIEHSASDDQYRQAVAKFQQAVLDDPPAIFLAWSERARAVNKRFEIPASGAGEDILNTLRLWRPAAGAEAARADTN